MYAKGENESSKLFCRVTKCESESEYDFRRFSSRECMYLGIQTSDRDSGPKTMSRMGWAKSTRLDQRQLGLVAYPTCT